MEGSERDREHKAESVGRPIPVIVNGSISPKDGRVLPSADDDDETERAGVFDYMPNATTTRKFSAPTTTTPSPRLSPSCSLAYDELEWGTDSGCNSNADLLRSQEMTTFRYSMVPSSPDVGPYPASADDDGLEEVVVQSEIMPQRASYERYNAESAKFVPSSSVYSSSGEGKDSYYSRGYGGDERDVIVRRSQENQC